MPTLLAKEKQTPKKNLRKGKRRAARVLPLESLVNISYLSEEHVGSSVMYAVAESDSRQASEEAKAR